MNAQSHPPLPRKMMRMSNNANQQNIFVWVAAAFLSLSWARNFAEMIFLVLSLGLIISLFRLSRPTVNWFFSKKISREKRTPTFSIQERAERICIGFAPLFLCAIVLGGLIPLLKVVLPSSDQRVVELIAFFTTCWTCVQLIPIPPFDGWYLVNGLLETLLGIRGFGLSLMIASAIGTLFSTCLVNIPLLDPFARTLMMALFTLLSLFCFKEWQEQRGKHLIDFDPKLQKQLALLKNRLSNRNLTPINADADQIYDMLITLKEKLPSKSQSHLMTCYLLALDARAKGHPQKALCMLIDCKDRLKGEALELLHELAYKLQNFSLVCHLSKTVFQNRPRPEIAVINGLAHAQQQQNFIALNWLQCAKREGYETWQLLQDPLFSSWSEDQLATLKQSTQQ